jgi:uncharacterized membrane protein YsdA (DUF1294 family)
MSEPIELTAPVVMGWFLVASIYTFLVFGWDKWRARIDGASRVSERHLLTASALGGWMGGLAAMLLFRHKTAKPSFKLKFAAAFLIWAVLIWAYWTRHQR